MVSSVSSLPKAGFLGDECVDGWLAALAAHRDASEIRRLRAAIGEARRIHGDELQCDGVQRVLGLLQTADILDQLQLDSDNLIAGLLSDAASRPNFDAQRIAEQFGGAVLNMVKALARLRELSASSDSDGRGDEKQLENLRRMLLGFADDVRVVLIVLAKRLQLMRVLKHFPRTEQLRIGGETHRIYAPLANRLGVGQVKWELEDLALRYTEPEAYQTVARSLEDKRQEREAFIAEVITRLRTECERHAIPAQLSGRPKHIYSIWRKMHRKKVEFSQIFDVRAVRVLVDSTAHCYEVLGIVHSLWQPIPSEFDDYIARPKANGYSSLHTAVVGEDGRPLEIQIRTGDMHEHAERGVAAHWRYKENRGEDLSLEQRIAWMRNWLEQQGEGEAAEALEDFDSESGLKRIYVLTPQGKVVELPQGATAVDFAYAIHSSVGHRCRGAKADGKIITLTQPLESGQTVEILTTKEGGPSRDWLNPHSHYIATSRARNRIRQWFKQQDMEKHLQLGRAALDREFGRLGIPRPPLDKLAPRFNFATADELLAAIGRGDVSVLQVANVQQALQPAKPADDMPPLKKKRTNKKKVLKGGMPRVTVQGVGDLMTVMAKCCKPMPGDGIIGYITKGRGVTVHREDCPVVQRMEPAQQQRLVPVMWSGGDQQAAFLVDIQVFAGDRKGLLRDISAVFSNEEIDVLGVNTQTDRRKERANMRFTVEVSDVSQLSRVMEKLAQVPDVLDVRRQV